MRLCIPVDADRGLQSPVCGHFGSAPVFLTVDTGSGDCRVAPNRNRDHQHGRCPPTASLRGLTFDAVAVAGIGPGALDKLQSAGIPVYLTRGADVDAVVTAFREGRLRSVTSDLVCEHHGRGGR